MSKLSDGFPESALHVKVQAKSKKTGKGLAVLYVDARNVMDRLDEVVGNENWSDEYHYIGSREVEDKHGKKILHDVECRLTVNGTTKADTGEGEDMKTAYSDAFKRAGVKFGIARYLYSSKTRWYELDDYGFFVEDDSKIIHELLGGDTAKKARAGTEKKETPKAQPEVITEPQKKKLYAMTKANGMTPEDAKQMLKKYGFSSSNEITKDKFPEIIKELEGKRTRNTTEEPTEDEMKAYADWTDRIPSGEKAKENFLDASRKRFFAFMKDQGMEGDDAKKYVKEALGVDISTNDILLDPDLRRKLNIKIWKDTGEVLFG